MEMSDGPKRETCEECGKYAGTWVYDVDDFGTVICDRCKKKALKLLASMPVVKDSVEEYFLQNRRRNEYENYC